MIINHSSLSIFITTKTPSSKKTHHESTKPESCQMAFFLSSSLLYSEKRYMGGGLYAENVWVFLARLSEDEWPSTLSALIYNSWCSCSEVIKDLTNQGPQLVSLTGSENPQVAT